MNIRTLIKRLDNQIHYLEECGNNYNEDLSNTMLEFSKDIDSVIQEHITNNKLSLEEIKELYKDTSSDYFKEQREMEIK